MTAISVEKLEKLLRELTNDEAGVRVYGGFTQIIWDALKSGALSPPPVAQGDGLPGGLLDSMKRIADMKDRDGNVIEMTAQELQGIARRAITCHENTRPTLAREWVPVSDKQIEEWAYRHDVGISGIVDLRCAYEDARTFDPQQQQENGNG